MPMQEQLVRVNTVLGNQTNLKIVGQSLGGLRAIAYAGYLNRPENNRSGNIDSVISIGGPVKGFSPLNQGGAFLMQKINDSINTVYGGWNAVKNLSVQPDSANTVENSGGIEGLVKSLGIDDSLISKVLNSMDDPTTSVPDLKPQSEFIKNNVYEVKSKWEWVKIYCWGVTLYLPHKVITSEIWKLPKNVKYGFIVGTDSEIVDMAHNMFRREIDDKLGGINPSILVSGYELTTAFAQVAWLGVEKYHDAMASIAWWNIFNRKPYRRHKQYAANARDWYNKASYGRKWVVDYEQNYSALLGTGVHENDCLIPVRDQYIDVGAEFQGQYIDSWTKGKFCGGTTTYNHLEETAHPEIWGTGGNINDSRIAADGKLAKWLYGGGNLDWEIMQGENVK